MLNQISAKVKEWLLIKSLLAAAKEQKLSVLAEKLKGIVEDISDQYSTFKINSKYLEVNVRNLHAFQVYLAAKVIKGLHDAFIVDIGDSSGTHIKYLSELFGKENNLSFLSVNLDDTAVKRIKDKNLKAIKSRAEDLDKYEINADVFLCFELLEHLMNPISFLRELSLKTKAKFLIVTVPYVRSSQVGLYHIRTKDEGKYACAENTHIFEFKPEDWKLIMKHCGWDIVEESYYYQYPRRGLFRLTKSLWRRTDFEGFYGLILKREHSWLLRYQDW